MTGKQTFREHLCPRRRGRNARGSQGNQSSDRQLVILTDKVAQWHEIPDCQFIDTKCVDQYHVCWTNICIYSCERPLERTGDTNSLYIHTEEAV